MRLTIELSTEDLEALARRINAQEDGLGYAEEDDDVALQTLTRLVVQGMLLQEVRSKETVRVFERDYEKFGQPRRVSLARRPKGRRCGI